MLTLPLEFYLEDICNVSISYFFVVRQYFFIFAAYAALQTALQILHICVHPFMNPLWRSIRRFKDRFVLQTLSLIHI